MKRKISRMLSLLLIVSMLMAIPVFAATYSLQIEITGPQYTDTHTQTGKDGTAHSGLPLLNANDDFTTSLGQAFTLIYDGSNDTEDGYYNEDGWVGNNDSVQGGDNNVNVVFVNSELHKTTYDVIKDTFNKNNTEWDDLTEDGKLERADGKMIITVPDASDKSTLKAQTTIAGVYNAEADHKVVFKMDREGFSDPSSNTTFNDTYFITVTIRTRGGKSGSSTPVETNPVVVVNEPTAGTETGTDQNTVDTSTDSATSGSRIIVTPKPQPGYKLQNLTVTDAYGNKVPTTKNPDGTFSFTMPDSQVNIRPTFIRVPESPEVTGTSKLLNTGDHILYLIGYPDGSVQPMGNITRAEVCMAFYRLLKNQNVETTVSYPDVKDGAWFAEAVKVISTLNIANGYPDGTFKPNQAITRAEFTAIATRFAEAKGGDVTFKDVPADYWAKDNIATAAAYGWINGYEDGTYRPANLITRAEAATIINHMLGREADGAFADANKTSLEQFTDLQDNSMWYYYDMVEATNAHDFTKSAGSEIWTKLNK